MTIIEKLASTSPIVNAFANSDGMLKDMFGKNNESNFGEYSSSPGSSHTKTITEIILLQPVNSAYPNISASPLSQMIQFIVLAIAIYMACKCKVGGKISFIQILLACLFSPCYILYRLFKPCKM